MASLHGIGLSHALGLGLGLGLALRLTHGPCRGLDRSLGLGHGLGLCHSDFLGHGKLRPTTICNESNTLFRITVSAPNK